jgi:hypothetical protein
VPIAHLQCHRVTTLSQLCERLVVLEEARVHGHVVCAAAAATGARNRRL